MSYIKKYDIKIEGNETVLKRLIKLLSQENINSHQDTARILQKNQLKEQGILSKNAVYNAYTKLKKSKKISLSKKEEEVFFKNVKMKKVRTLSGVTPVTVLTKPFPCPGQCIFCPNDVRMPKSYLASEPGAQRAEANYFDPYHQTFNRLIALRNIGHPTEKIELIILGGTWTHYPNSYRIWFVKRCFDAMNDFSKSKRKTMLKPTLKESLSIKLLEEIKGESMKRTYNQIVAKSLLEKAASIQKEKATYDELFDSHKKNETAKARCIGLVIETRPDELDEKEIINIRKLGATKVQIGIQSLNDKVLKMNKRGHDSKRSIAAVGLLRRAGFKIHAHWMPNLYGSTPEMDVKDFKKLFEENSIFPDELKIYPCSLIESAELMKYYKKGSWEPYSEEELRHILSKMMMTVPNYCRVTRMIRDIPGGDIVTGNKKTNFRQIVEDDLKKAEKSSKDIRAREIKDKKVSFDELELKITEYSTSVSKEVFFEYVTKGNEIAAFLRLSLPLLPGYISELKNSSIIREIHVYGESLLLGERSKGKAQHMGLGKLLIKNACGISKERGYKQISVISSVGTRKYYEKNGFSAIDLNNKKSSLYQHKEL